MGCRLCGLTTNSGERVKAREEEGEVETQDDTHRLNPPSSMSHFPAYPTHSGTIFIHLHLIPTPDNGLFSIFSQLRLPLVGLIQPGLCP